MFYIKKLCRPSGSKVIPVELVPIKRLDLSHPKVFIGCPTFVHIGESRRKKLGETAWKAVFVGYAFNPHAWIVYNPATRKLIRSRTVVFDELRRKNVAVPARITENTAEFDPEDNPLSPGEVHESLTPKEPEVTSPSKTKQLELERIISIIEAPRTRSERAQSARASELNREVNPSDVAILLAITEPTSYPRAVKVEEKSK
jgi:hypothetical protein